MQTSRQEQRSSHEAQLPPVEYEGPPVSPKESAPTLSVDYQEGAGAVLGRSPEVDLVNEHGEYTGQARVRQLTRPDMIAATEVQRLHEEDAVANDIEQRIDDEGAPEALRETMADTRLEAFMSTTFRNFHDAGGGDVFEATNVTWQDNRANTGSVSPADSTSDRGVRTFVIAKSAADAMKGLLTGSIERSALDVGMGVTLDEDPVYNGVLGDRGFSKRVRIDVGAGQPPKELRISFVYGKERDSELSQVANDESEASTLPRAA